MPTKRKHVIIIDDDAAILEALRRMFEMHPGTSYVVETANNSEILTKMNGMKPDLILLDLRLSGEDGADIARFLKDDKRTSAIPIIMMSAHPSAERYMRASGADEFVAKPFDMMHMFDKVAKLTDM